jgi:hypothetical protein
VEIKKLTSIAFQIIEVRNEAGAPHFEATCLLLCDETQARTVGLGRTKDDAVEGALKRMGGIAAEIIADDNLYEVTIT